MTRTNTESGAVLLYILIAVALLAGLSAIMSRSGQVSQSTLSDQQAKIAAQEIIDYGNTVANAVQKMRLRGCGDNQLDPYNTSWKRANESYFHTLNANVNAPSDQRCSLFSPAGGNLTAIITPASYLRSFSTMPTGTATSPGSWSIIVTAMPGIGTAAEDISLFLAYVSDEVCLQINRHLGIEHDLGDAPPHTFARITYTGAFPGTQSVGDVSGVLTGKTAYCANDQAATYPNTDNRFFQVLSAR